MMSAAAASEILPGCQLLVAAAIGVATKPGRSCRHRRHAAPARPAAIRRRNTPPPCSRNKRARTVGHGRRHRADDGDRARASLRHRRDRRLDRVEDADHIDRQRRAHGLGSSRICPVESRSRRPRWHTRYRAARAPARPPRLCHAGAVLHVDDGGRDVGALVAAGFRGSFKPRLVAPEQRESRAVLRMAQRQRAADAAGGPGNQTCFPPNLNLPIERLQRVFFTRTGLHFA